MKGLGDLVKAGLNKLGVKPCGGCDKRAAWLNRLTPGYRPPTRPSFFNPRHMFLSLPGGRVAKPHRDPTGAPRVSYRDRAMRPLYPLSAYPISGGSNIIAFDGSQSDLTAKLSGAIDGDTLLAPVGTFQWATQNIINKGVTVMGAGSTQTIITDHKARANGGDGILLDVNVPPGGLFRLTGFRFQPDGIQGFSDSMIHLNGCSINNANYRIDNNEFLLVNTNHVIRFFGNLYGVMDHNFATAGTGGGHLAATNNTTWPRDGATCSGGWGDGSWAFPLAPGTIKAHYLENNTWWASDFSGSIIDSAFGGRAVLRHNTINNTFVGSHGTDTTDRFRGSRWMEVYDNVFNYQAGVVVNQTVWVRGGSAVVLDNDVTMPDRSIGFDWYVKHLNLRSNDPGGAHGALSPWNSPTNVAPACDGRARWDGNTGGSPCTAGNDLCVAGYRCLDQPGAGTSVDYLDVTDTQTVSPATSGKANNTLEPIYVWNNKIQGSADNCGNQVWSCGSDGVVVAGRDIIYGTARPSYTKFTYPHPLIDGTVIPPGPVVLRTKIRK
jgi:hypothetical protein